MIWEKWTKDNLPPAKAKILVWYKSGFHAATEYFYNEAAREYAKEFLELESTWSEKTRDLLGLKDPITHWMLFPEGPSEEVDA